MSRFLAWLWGLLMALRLRVRLVDSSGGGDPEPGGLLTTLTFLNDTGSNASSGWMTKMFGHPWKKGDLPAGEYPQFQLTNGTPCPATIEIAAVWNDGSAKYTKQWLVIPTAVSDGAFVEVEALSGGSAPASASVGIADLSAENFITTLTGIDNLSDAWAAAVNLGISEGTVTTLMDGEAGLLVKVEHNYKQSGSPHGQFVEYDYIQVLQNASSALYGFRWLGRWSQPWFNVDSPAKIKRDFSVACTNGATPVCSPAPNPPVVGATISNGSAVWTKVAHGLTPGVACRLSNSGGGLPGNFSSSTTYYVGIINDDTYILTTTSARDALGGSGASGKVTASSSGSGTHILTSHVECMHFGSGFNATADGGFNYVQGNGSSASDPQIHIKFDQDYWISTKMVQPYDTSVTPDAATAYDYAPNRAAPLRHYFPGVGTDGTIGTDPVWVSQHFLGQTEDQWKNVVVAALNMGTCANNVRNSATRTIQVVNATSGTPYANMGTASETFRWEQANGYVSGFTAPTGDLTGMIIPDASHAVCALYYAQLITGEPQYDDLAIEWASWLLTMRYTGTDYPERNNTSLAGGPYYGITFYDMAARADAWTNSIIARCAALIRTDAVEHDYLWDLVTDSYAYIKAWNAAQTSFWTTNGIPMQSSPDGYRDKMDPWQINYGLHSQAHAYLITEIADIKTQCEYTLKFWAAINADIGLYWLTCYRLIVWTGANTFITNINQIYFVFMSWSAANSGDLLTVSALPANYDLANNARAKWIANAPSGLSNYTNYYSINVTDPGSTSSKTLQLSTSQGGSASAINADGSGFEDFGMRVLGTPPAAGWGVQYANNDSYTEVLYGAMRMCEAAGMTGASVLRTVSDGMEANAFQVDHAAFPMHALTASY